MNLKVYQNLVNSYKKQKTKKEKKVFDKNLKKLVKKERNEY